MSMLVSLKNIHDSIIQERYSHYHTPEERKQSYQRGSKLLSNPELTRKAIIKIYELEYKLFRMALYKRKHGDWLHDTANIRYLQWKNALEKVLSDSIEHLYNNMLGWAIVEEHVHIIDERYPGGRRMWREDVAQAMQYEHPDVPRLSPEYERVKHEVEAEMKDEFFEEIWDDEETPYPAVQKALESLKNPTGTVQEKIVMFHKGLTTAHNNGKMLEYSIRDGNAIKNRVLLDDLSNGSYIPQWNEELKGLGLIEDGLQLVEATTKHPAPEELAKVLL